MTLRAGALKGVKSEHCDVVLKSECECEWSEWIDLPKLEKLEKGRGCFENSKVVVESGY